MASSSLNNVLRNILFRRRNRVIVSTKGTINDIFKKNIESSISKIDDLNNLNIVVEKCEGLSVTINFNGMVMEFNDGKLKNQKLRNRLSCSSSSKSSFFNIIKEETQKIKSKMVYALTFNKELQNLGYCMDEMLFNVVAALPSQKVKSLSDELIPYIKILIGANVTYRPLYPNFPSQVMEMKTIDLYINALIHYWSSGEYYPSTEVKKRSKAPISVKFKYITLGKEKDLHDLFFNIMNSAEAISPQDSIDLTTYFKNYDFFMDTVPENIRNKENLAIITKLILTHCKEPDMEKISRRFSTVTDVLRLAAVLSDQSATLCGKVRFKSFPQKERRFLMELLNSCGNRVDDFHKHKNLWVRLCERIHPKKYRKIYPDLVDDLEGTYKYIQEKKNLQRQKQSIDTIHRVIKNNCPIPSTKLPGVKDAISQLKKLKFNKDLIKKVEDHIEEKDNRKKSVSSVELDQSFSSIQNKNESKIMELEEKVKEYKDTHRTFNSKLEKFINEKKFNETLKLLVNRPGLLARRLDDLLTKTDDKSEVIEAFEEIASQVSVKVLLSLKGYFQKRHEKLKVRVFLIKSETTSKLYMKRKVKEELELEVCQKICHICEEALKTYFEQKSKMNNVYISEDLKKHVIPLDLRSTNASIETYVKGSRFDIDTFNKLSKEELELCIEEFKESKTKLEKEAESFVDIFESKLEEVIKDFKLYVMDIRKEMSHLMKDVESNEQEISKLEDFCHNQGYILTIIINGPKKDVKLQSISSARALRDMNDLKDENATLKNEIDEMKTGIEVCNEIIVIIGREMECQNTNTRSNNKCEISNNLKKECNDEDEIKALQKKINTENCIKKSEKLTKNIEMIMKNKRVDSKTSEKINVLYGILENYKTLQDSISTIENSIKLYTKNLESIEKDDGNLVSDKKVRLFIWWTNTKTRRIDIDLSMMLYDEDLHQLSHVSFTNLRDSEFKIYHSGDITNGGDINGPGAAEFIDFDPEEIYKNGARYIAISVICFSGVTFNELDNCKFGWMEREDLNSNELFEPKTVRQTLDVRSQNTSTVPVVFDCKTREVVWIDSNLTENKGCVRIERSQRPMNAILYYYLNPLKDSMYNLLKLHVEARDGHLVGSKEKLQEGDIAFVSCLPYKRIPGVEYVRPTDLDVILSEYMTVC